MKKVIALFIALLVCGPVYADTKIKDLTSDTSPASTDMIPKTDGSTTKQSTIANILKNETDPKAGAVTGIVKSNGSGTFSAVTDNSTNWDKYSQWDGGSTGLTAATGRTSLGLGSVYQYNVGTLTDGKGCVYSSGTTAFVCNSTFLTAESDATALAKTINSKALSTNPVLNATDVGLGNVANTAQVTSVTGTAPITASVGTTPAIGFNWSAVTNIMRANMNWTDINSMAVHQSAGFNWSSVPVNTITAAQASLGNVSNVNWQSTNAIQSAAMNWTSLTSSQIQKAGVNWTSLSSDIQSVGLNWSSVTKLLFPTASSAGTYTGNTLTVTSTETQGIGDAVMIDTNGKAHLAKADAIANASAVLLAATAVTGSASNTYLLPGGTLKLSSSPTWTVGGLIFLTTTGTTGNTLTQTAPSGANNVIQVLGVALAADTILFEPSLTQIEHT